MDILPFVGAAAPIAQAISGSAVLIKVIDRVADHIGIVRRPDQILREGEAQAIADAKTLLIKQSLNHNATHRERLLARGLLADSNRTIREQHNNESILLKALPEVKEDAKPEEVEDDWFANFFDRSRLISDQEMQMLWSKLLAGEINQPGTFSRRAINFLSSFDKKDANDFLSVCQRSCTIDKKPLLPMMYNTDRDSSNDTDLSFNTLENLDGIGLLKHNPIGFYMYGIEKTESLLLQYYDIYFIIEWEERWNGKFQRGNVMFTDIGTQIARLSSPKPVADFENYLVQQWKQQGCKVTIHRPNQPPQDA